MPDLKGVRKAGQDIYTVNFADYLPGALKHDLKMRAIAEAVTKEALTVSGEIENVLIYSRIDELPEELIDILAYDMHVDWYDYAYSLKEKRDIIKKSVKVHKKMGTIHAIKVALSSLYEEVKIIEWFEYGGNPYTFRVEINVTDYYETIENKNKIVKIICMYKRLSAHLEFIIYRIVGIHKVKIKYDTTITYTSNFYPRYNVPNLYFDGTWFWDGSYTLDGYADSKKYDFYPLQLFFCGEFFLQNKKIDTFFAITERTFFRIFFKSKSLEILGAVIEDLRQSSKLEMTGSIEQHTEITGELTVEKDLWYLDGTYKLDGEKLLDAEIFHYKD